jgi:hypothetical protein
MVGCVDNGQMCTEEFKIVGVEITGETLDDHFTIRMATGDTLRHSHDISETFYTVLDDNMQSTLEGKSEMFNFIGIKNGSKVVEEEYEFEADECHIERITGPTEIDL